MAEIKNGEENASSSQENDELKSSEGEGEEETMEEVKAKLAKAEEIATNQRIRAEKAEKAAKANKPVVEGAKVVEGDLSTKDLYALMEAKVPQDDIEEVREYAALKKISIVEALKAPIIKSILSERSEQRNTANAANVGGSKRGTGKVSDDILLSKASKGELPDNDADLDRLIRLRKGIK